ncbi:MAG: hypothetical protein O2931_00545 [Planctomycetota bacterium]|nr:hypothetical protein [Planctomycetota bacterium]MDA1177262.1 hypothetical protein [Planctomycetota bacterium]
MLRPVIVFLLVGAGIPSVLADDELARKAGPATVSSQRLPTKVSTDHLPNCIRVNEKVFSGGQPDGELGYQELQAFGIKTVISVDGAVPDVETAAKYGLRYVHLPHGYDGISAARAKELAKGVRDFEGPIYLHCHHGMHRSPAAAAVACVTAGLLLPAEAIEVLEIAGTNRGYRGLYQSVKDATPVDGSDLDRLVVDFRSQVDVPPIADAMVALERILDHLNAFAAAGWQASHDQRGLEPSHEALLLREQFTELLRIENVQKQPDEFGKLIRDSELAAEEMEQVLRDFGQEVSRKDRGTEQLGSLIQRITKNCNACHEKFRDVPLNEKHDAS